MATEYVKTGLTVISGVALAVPAVAVGKAVGTIIGIGCGLGAAYAGAHYLVDKFGDKIINGANTRFAPLHNLFKKKEQIVEVIPVPTPTPKRRARAAAA